MRTDSTSIFGASDDPEIAERARRATAAFRKMQPGLSGFARMITKRDDVRVEMFGGVPCTDGKIIYLRPPIELGDRLTHERGLCEKRDELDRPACPACCAREDVLITLYHEIAHIAFDSFEQVSDYDKEELIKRAVQEAGASAATSPERVKKIEERLASRSIRGYMEAAHAVSPYLPPILNALEDVRVNHAMYSARPGTFPMFRGQAVRIFNEGIQQADGSFKKWNEMGRNAQVIVGLFAKAAGYSEWADGWFSDDVTEALADADLTALIAKVPTLRSARQVYQLAFPVLEQLRGLGFCKAKDDPEEEPEPQPEPETPQPDPRETDDEQEPTPGDGEPCDDGESGEGGTPSESDDEDGEKPAESEDGEDTEGDSDTEGDAGEGGSEDQSEQDGDDAEGDDDSEDATGEGAGDGADADDADDESEDAEGGSAGDDDEDGEAGSGDGSGESDEDEDGESGSGEGGADEESDGDEDGEAGTDGGSGEAPGDDEEDGQDGGEGGGDSGCGDLPYDGPAPASIPEDDDEPTGEGDGPGEWIPEDADEDADDANVALNVFGGHGPIPDDPKTDVENTAVDRAIAQEAFDAPSRNIFGVRMHYWNKHAFDPTGRDMTELLSWSARYSYGGYSEMFGTSVDSIHAPETVLGPSLLRMRAAFAENKRADVQRNLKSGRIDTAVLGRRIAAKDDRLFQKRRYPGKRDYFVVIGMDLSGSTADGTVKLIKQAAMAQAELCHRAGVRFAVYGHTGYFHDMANPDRAEYGGSGMDVEIFVVKEENDPWDTAARERLAALVPAQANLDGHTIEFYRKRCDESRATDKIILYYTDGLMPAENEDEELVVLQREIKLCQRKGYTLLGIGCGTDSPTRHGLDTARVDSIEDLPVAVRHLEKRLAIRRAS